MHPKQKLQLEKKAVELLEIFRQIGREDIRMKNLIDSDYVNAEKSCNIISILEHKCPVFLRVVK